MKRINTIINPIMELHEENMNLRAELERMKIINDLSSDNKEINKNTWLIEFAERTLLKLFKEATEWRRRDKIKLNDSGAIITVFDKWYDDVFEYHKEKYTDDRVPAYAVKELIRSGARTIFEDDCNHAKMEWVRSHKEGAE